MGVLGDSSSLEIDSALPVSSSAARMPPQSIEQSPLSEVAFFIEDDDIDTVYELESNPSAEFEFMSSQPSATTPPLPAMTEPYDLNTSLHFLRQAYQEDDDESATDGEEEQRRFHAQQASSFHEQEMMARYRRSIFRGAHQVVREGYVADESDTAIEFDRMDATLVAFMLAVKLLCVCTVVLNMMRWLISFVALGITSVIESISSKMRESMHHPERDERTRSSRPRRAQHFQPLVFEDYIPHDFNIHDDLMMMHTEDDFGQVHSTEGDTFQHPVVQDIATRFADLNHHRLAILSSSAGVGMGLVVIAGVWSMARLMLNIVSKKRRQWRERESEARLRGASSGNRNDGVNVERMPRGETFGDDGGWGAMRESAQQWLAGEDLSRHTPGMMEEEFGDDDDDGIPMDGFLACPTVLERRVMKELNKKMCDFKKTLQRRDFVTVFTMTSRKNTTQNKSSVFNGMPGMIESYHSDSTTSDKGDDELQGSLHSDASSENAEVDSVVVDEVDVKGAMEYNLRSICPSSRQLTFCLPLPGTRIDDAMTMGTGDWQFWRYDVPPVCAICLCPYEEGDVLAWSSNTQCQHVFHKDCITAWFMKRRLADRSQARRRHLEAEGWEEPTDVHEPTPCPCCRHDFIAREEN